MHGQTKVKRPDCYTLGHRYQAIFHNLENIQCFSNNNECFFVSKVAAFSTQAVPTLLQDSFPFQQPGEYPNANMDSIVNPPIWQIKYASLSVGSLAYWLYFILISVPSTHKTRNLWTMNGQTKTKRPDCCTLAHRYQTVFHNLDNIQCLQQ